MGEQKMQSLVADQLSQALLSQGIALNQLGSLLNEKNLAIASQLMSVGVSAEFLATELSKAYVEHMATIKPQFSFGEPSETPSTKAKATRTTKKAKQTKRLKKLNASKKGNKVMIDDPDFESIQISTTPSGEIPIKLMNLLKKAKWGAIETKKYSQNVKKITKRGTPYEVRLWAVPKNKYQFLRDHQKILASNCFRLQFGKKRADGTMSWNLAQFRNSDY